MIINIIFSPSCALLIRFDQHNFLEYSLKICFIFIHLWDHDITALQKTNLLSQNYIFPTPGPWEPYTGIWSSIGEFCFPQLIWLFYKIDLDLNLWTTSFRTKQVLFRDKKMQFIGAERTRRMNLNKTWQGEQENCELQWMNA